MTDPSSAPRGEHAPRPGITWQAQLVSSGEVVIPDGPWGGPALMTMWGDGGPAVPAKPNRASRRAIARAARRKK
jgi:hypothetical protein